MFTAKTIIDEYGVENETNMVCISHPATMETVCPPSVEIPELKPDTLEEDIRCYPTYPVPEYYPPKEYFCVEPMDGSIILVNCDNTDLFGSAITVTIDDTAVSGEPAGELTFNLRSKE